MNTQIIRNTKTKKLPYMPTLTGVKTNRVVTKHYTNAVVYMDPNKFSFLTWLIYQSRNDNTFRYTTHLLNKYKESIKASKDQYGGNNRLNIGIKSLRNALQDLIQEGYVFHTKEKDSFMINPLLTYRAEYIRKEEYSDICQRYNSHQIYLPGTIDDLAQDFSNIINKRIKDKTSGKKSRN